jgi:sugar/nucleoside kinase (ribokinase family)
VRVGIGAFRDLVSGVDLLLPNLDEARLLAGTADRDGIEDAAATASSLLDLAHNVVVTAGAEGAVAAQRNADGIETLPVPPVDVVDTTGAGDAFAAGYLAALMDGAQPAACLARGGRVAARAVGAVGAQPLPQRHPPPAQQQ